MQGHDDESAHVNGVSADRRGHALYITIRRPEKRNALDRALADAALSAVAGAHGDAEARVIVIAGEGGTLSSGADLSDPSEFAASRRDYAGDPRARLLRAIHASAIPVVAVVDGYALGLGMALAGAATFAVATERSEFGMPEAPMGFFPFGVVPFLVERVAISSVLEWALTARRITAEEAHRSGLVTHLVRDGESQRVLDELVDGLISVPRPVLVAGVRWQAQARNRISTTDLIAWCEAAIGEDADS